MPGFAGHPAEVRITAVLLSATGEQQVEFHFTAEAARLVLDVQTTQSVGNEQ